MVSCFITSTMALSLLSHDSDTVVQNYRKRKLDSAAHNTANKLFCVRHAYKSCHSSGQCDLEGSQGSTRILSERTDVKCTGRTKSTTTTAS